MNRTLALFALLLASAAALAAQQAAGSEPYQGVSNPPADEVSPYAAQRTETESVYSPIATPAPRPRPDSYAPANDDGIVTVPVAHAESPAPGPGLRERAPYADPDGDIVHPRPLRAGEIEVGTLIRVRLLGRLSTSSSERGEAFRSRVANDVLSGGRVVLPAGAEIDGKVIEVSHGHAMGHGTMRLLPETVILADGTRYNLRAQLVATPGSHARVGDEGQIRPASRAGRDAVEYGGVMGAGAVTGAILAGPGGALAGTLVGAGVVTAHLLVSHPQATLEPGAPLLFTLSERLSLVPAGASGE